MNSLIFRTRLSANIFGVYSCDVYSPPIARMRLHRTASPKGWGTARSGPVLAGPSDPDFGLSGIDRGVSSWCGAQICTAGSDRGALGFRQRRAKAPR